MIIIAQQLSTVIAASQVLVLDRGQIVQRGTHAKLSSISGGIYEVLIGGLAIALVTGIAGGLYPAGRAAKMSPIVAILLVM